MTWSWSGWSIVVRAERRTSCGQKTGLRRHFSSFAKIFTNIFSHHHPTTDRIVGPRVWKKQIALVPQNGVTQELPGYVIQTTETVIL